jgi:DNA-binding transcriptional MerR regulator
VTTERLLSIGSFAMLTGLTITALRHYDTVGLLPPAAVDPSSGYRRYRAEQVGTGRLIGALRRLELPVDGIREVLRDLDGSDAAAVLAAHRDHLRRRAAALAALADQCTDLGIEVPTVDNPRIVQATIAVTDRAGLIQFYEAAFGATFDESIGSFSFGSWPGDDFSCSRWRTRSGIRGWPGRPGSGCWSATSTRRTGGHSTRVRSSWTRRWTSRGSRAGRASPTRPATGSTSIRADPQRLARRARHQQSR